MKAARLVVLGVAVVAGGVAALLAGRSDKSEPAPEPAAKMETVDVLVAKAGIGPGRAMANVAGNQCQSGFSAQARATGRDQSDFRVHRAHPVLGWRAHSR